MVGYPYAGRATVESRRAIDVHDLAPGKLTPGLSGRVRWSRCGELTGLVNFTIEADAVVLGYQRPDGASEWKEARQRVPLAWTACALGGRRPWFRCRCGRRAAILYDRGDAFACRRCCGLAYESQSESPIDRGLRRAHAIRERLGGEFDIFSPFPPKPRGMHRRTYDRLRDRGLAADRRAIDAIARYLDRPVRR